MTVMAVVFRLGAAPIFTKVVLTETNLLHIVNSFVIRMLSAKVILKVHIVYIVHVILQLLLLVRKGVKSTPLVITML